MPGTGHDTIFWYFFYLGLETISTLPLYMSIEELKHRAVNLDGKEAVLGMEKISYGGTTMAFRKCSVNECVPYIRCCVFIFIFQFLYYKRLKKRSNCGLRLNFSPSLQYIIKIQYLVNSYTTIRWVAKRIGGSGFVSITGLRIRVQPKPVVVDVLESSPHLRTDF